MVLLTCFLLLFSLPAFADIDAAIEAFNNKEYSAALKEFKAEAEKDNTEAIYYLGVMHERGFGVAKNVSKAYDYYVSAAEKGHGKSALKLGQAYQTGVDRPQNTKAAYKWFVVSAKANNDQALYIIGSSFLKEENYEKAIKLLMMSATQGNNDAQYELGNIYFAGNGVPQDYAQAIAWYTLSANQGNISAQRKLADLYSSTTVRGLLVNPGKAHFWYNIIAAYNTGLVRDDAVKKREQVSEEMKPELIIASQAAARKWKKKTKAESIPKIRDGRIYTDSELKNSDLSLIATMKVEDRPSSVKVSNELEEAVDIQAVNLGIDKEIVADAVKNSDFFPVLSAVLPLAEKNNIKAMNLVGDLYSQNIPGIPKDYNLATKWYNKSAQSGDPVGQFKLGTMLCEGKGMDANLVECYKWFLIVEGRVSANADRYLRNTMSKVSNTLDEQETKQAVVLANQYKVDVLHIDPIKKSDDAAEISNKDFNEISDSAERHKREEMEKEKAAAAAEAARQDTIIKGKDAKKKKEKDDGFSLF